MITQEYLRECMDYDPESGVLTWKRRPREHFPTQRGFSGFNARFAGKEAGNLCQHGTVLYREIRVSDKLYKAHRLVWMYVHGEWPENLIDHINGDGTDNRLCNLRSTCKSGNAKNARRPTNNSSGVIGVSWSKARGKWEAYINHGPQRERLGHHNSLLDAAAARKSAEHRHGFSENHGRAA